MTAENKSEYNLAMTYNSSFGHWNSSREVYVHARATDSETSLFSDVATM